MTFHRLSRIWRILLAVALLHCAATVAADEIADIGKLLKSGQLEQASQKADAYLATKPRDAQGQFLKGLILTEQNKTAEAIAAFTRLTELYPELPEPYNNLAVLYAGQGQFERARQALEMAIRTHPSYATAHENLGDVYAKLASQAYDKALQLDSGNATAQTKLALVRDLIGSGTRAKPQVAQAVPLGGKAAPPSTAAAPAKPAPVPPIPTAPAVAPPAAKSAVAVAAPVAAAPGTAPAAAAKDTKSAAVAAAPAATKEPVSKAAENDKAEVVAAVNAWAGAWARQDVATYLSAYARDFKLPRGESRQAWEASRKSRVSAPKKIEVSIDNPVVSFDDAGIATVKFRQHYKSNIVSARSAKMLVMSKAGGKWQIREERSGG